MANSGLSQFELAYVISPIILTGGLAQNMGGSLPIVALTDAAAYSETILAGPSLKQLNQFFAKFQLLPGHTLIDQSIGTYPFANQTVAANAVIAQPLKISFLMICPANENNSYAGKQAIITALQASLLQHNFSGGTYILKTPSYIFTNCVMSGPGLRDASNTESNQPQNTFQLDFIKPLITLNDAQAAQNSLMNAMSNGTQINGQPTWSGQSPQVGGG